jgi:hypothetical protein
MPQAVKARVPGRQMEIVLYGPAHRPLQTTLPDAREHALDNLLRIIGRLQVAECVSTQSIPVCAEELFEYRQIASADSFDERNIALGM